MHRDTAREKAVNTSGVASSTSTQSSYLSTMVKVMVKNSHTTPTTHHFWRSPRHAVWQHYGCVFLMQHVHAEPIFQLCKLFPRVSIERSVSLFDLHLALQNRVSGCGAVSKMCELFKATRGCIYYPGVLIERQRRFSLHVCVCVDLPSALLTGLKAPTN